MTTTYKIPGYFTVPTSQLEALERERERIQGCADRNAQHYAQILHDMDAEIAALKAQEAKVNNICDCGNAEKLPGYRVCEDCKWAREMYPHLHEGEPPDKIEENGDLTGAGVNDTDPTYSDASIGLPARSGGNSTGGSE